jgi:hypothetical protein
MKSEWIKCSDRMPDKSGSYLTWGGYDWSINYYDKNILGWRCLFTTTHWMPLPAGPDVP